MKRLLIIAFVALFTCKASAQKAIKAKDASKYIGEEKWLEGKIISVASPGYSSSISYYVGTDTIEQGLAVDIPMRVWSMSKKLASSTLKGKLVKVNGVIKVNHQQPYIQVRDTAAIKLF